jgi:DNA-binding SARP family transcriptional activator
VSSGTRGHGLVEHHGGSPVAARAAVGAGRARPRVAGRLTLLNAFGLYHEGLEVPLSVPAQRLLAFLALQDHPVLRDYIAGTLWIDATQEHATGSLRSALFRLRQPRCELVEATGNRLRLASRLVVDVREAVTWARLLLDRSPEVGDVDVRVMAFSGDILPDWYDDWVTLERERFRELRLHALEVLCARLVSAGRFGEAMEAGLAAVKGEPLRESAHRAVISVHLAEGNRAEALEEYRRFQQRLQRDLGLAPSVRMDQLLGHIMVQ